MRIFRPALLCTLVIGIAMTLSLGPSVLKPTGAGAQTGYGDFGALNTIPPRVLAIGAADGSWWLLIVIAILVALGTAVAVYLRNRQSSD